MMTLLHATGSILILAAQWAPYPTPGVPKGPDGKPNLSAPAPRTAEGKPDLSGIWQNIRPPAGQRGPGETPPPPPPPPPGTPPVATFRDVGAGFKRFFTSSAAHA